MVTFIPSLPKINLKDCKCCLHCEETTKLSGLERYQEIITSSGHVSCEIRTTARIRLSADNKKPWSFHCAAGNSLWGWKPGFIVPECGIGSWELCVAAARGQFMTRAPEVTPPKLKLPRTQRNELAQHLTSSLQELHWLIEMEPLPGRMKLYQIIQKKKKSPKKRTRGI